MTLQEFEYIKRAVEALEDPEITDMTQRKILKTVAQICDRNAARIEDRLMDRFDAKMERAWQDRQNQKLVDMLR